MFEESIPEVFLDTDVAFDIISGRAPHAEISMPLLHWVEKGEIRLTISEFSIANLIYLSNDIYKLDRSNDLLTAFIKSCKVIHTSKKSILSAMASTFKDKEDAVQYHSAIANQCDYFTTRNLKDYVKHTTSLEVHAPSELIEILRTKI